ncbi:MAG: hypothetical protein AAEJ53_04160, partial [Myxococcota bacterium]
GGRLGPLSGRLGPVGVSDRSVYPHLSRWYERLRSRPAVERALALDRESGSVLPEYYRKALFDEG